MRQTVEEILKGNQTINNLEDFEEIYNPPKLYSRLIHLGIPKEICENLKSVYKRNWYDPFMKAYKNIYNIQDEEKVLEYVNHEVEE